MKIKQLYDKLLKMFKSVIASDKQRRRFLFSCVIGSLFLTSLCMSVVNFFTREYYLLIATLLYFALCFAVIAFLHIFHFNETAVYLIFAAGTLAMLSFFIVSGSANGFSCLWMCLIPSFSLFIFGLRNGSVFSFAAFLLMLFFFETPIGNSLLLYQYSAEFKLRFPFLYAAIFLLSVIIELVRKETQSQLEASKKEFGYFYRHDYLTGLYNRYGIREFGLKIAENVSGFSAIIFDIDDFKQINDKYGHECGDVVLKSVADTSVLFAFEEGRCCRWGGEEFLFIMGCENGAEIIAEKIRAEIENTPIIYGNETLHITVSVGVCSAAKGSVSSVHDIIELADKALYRAKAEGKNRVCVYDGCKIPETVL